MTTFILFFLLAVSMGPDGGEPPLIVHEVLGFTTAYLFIDSERGIPYWFDRNRKVKQIVVAAPEDTDDR